MSDPASTPQAREQLLFEGHPAVCASALDIVIAVLTVGLALLYYWARSKSVHYRITTERVVVERGLFSKRLDQIDLYRINDYVVDRPFLQRLAGTGNLVLTAMDRTTPDLRLDGLSTDVVALYEQLRKATEEQKRARNVRPLDADYPAHH